MVEIIILEEEIKDIQILEDIFPLLRDKIAKEGQIELIRIPRRLKPKHTAIELTHEPKGIPVEWY